MMMPKWITESALINKIWCRHLWRVGTSNFLVQPSDIWRLGQYVYLETSRYDYPLTLHNNPEEYNPNGYCIINYSDCLWRNPYVLYRFQNKLSLGHFLLNIISYYDAVSFNKQTVHQTGLCQSRKSFWFCVGRHCFHFGFIRAAARLTIINISLQWWNKSNKMQQLRFLFPMALL